MRLMINKCILYYISNHNLNKRLFSTISLYEKKFIFHYNLSKILNMLQNNPYYNYYYYDNVIFNLVIFIIIS